jgi:hypothetical protein
MRHLDSTLWYRQVVTGLLLFFLASVHVYAIITQPDRISVEFAVRRIVDERAWLLYVLLTPIAQLHTLTGLYRFALKWGLVGGEDPRRTRDGCAIDTAIQRCLSGPPPRPWSMCPIRRRVLRPRRASQWRPADPWPCCCA